MGKLTLDRNRYYGIVYGDDSRKFYQDGVYFDGGGAAIDSGREATPPAENEPDSGVSESRTVMSEAEAKLASMNVAQLKKAARTVADATGEEPERWTGTGIADVLRAFILANTE